VFDLDYALKMLRQAIDFAEAEQDFRPVRKWANEVELAAKEGKGKQNVNKISDQES